MTNLIESSTWESGIYQLETDDPTLGGQPGFNMGEPVTGHANAQALQLANRTSYLKQRVDADLPSTFDVSKGAAMVGRGIQVVKTIAEAKTLLKTSASKYAEILGYYAQGDGGGGIYYLDESDTISVDNGGSIIVANDGGRWKLNHRGLITVKQFGAVGNGVTSDVASVNAAIAYVNSLSASVTLLFNSGRYNLKAGVTQKITKDHVSIIGENAFIDAEVGSIFTFDNTVQMRRSSVRGFTFQYTFPTVDQNAVPISCNKVLYMRIKEIRVINAPSVMYLDGCSNLIISDITGTTVNIAKNAIHFNSCSVVDMDDVSLITDAGLQPVNPATPFPNPPVSGNTFIRITGAINDTYRIKSGVLCNRYHRGIYSTTNTGEVLLNVSIDNVVLDYCYDKGIYVDNTGGSVSNVEINQPYVQAMQGIGIHVRVTSGLTDEVKIVRPKILLSGIHSIFMDSAPGIGIRNAIIEEPSIIGGNRLNSGGIDINCSYTRFRLRGGRVGVNSLSLVGLSLQANYGVFASNCDQYTVTGIEAGGVSGSFVFTSNPASDYRARLVHDNKTVVGNSVSTKPDYETTTLTAVVSGGTYTNTSPYKEYVSVFGVTASGNAVLEVNGVSYSNRTEWSGILNPGDTLKVTTGVSCNRRITRLP